MTAPIPPTLAQNIPLLEAIQAGGHRTARALAEAAGVSDANLSRKMTSLAAEGAVILGATLQESALTDLGERAIAAAKAFETGAPAAAIHAIPLPRLDLHPRNPRRPASIDPQEIENRAQSIADVGVLNPITVRPHPDRPGDFQVLLGELRTRGARLAADQGWIPADFAMPAIVRDCDDLAALKIMGVDNIQRTDMHWLDEALHYRDLNDAGASSAEIERMMGKRRKRSIQDLIRVARALDADLYPRCYLPDTDPDHLGLQACLVMIGARKDKAAEPATPAPALDLPAAPPSSSGGEGVRGTQADQAAATPPPENTPPTIEPRTPAHALALLELAHKIIGDPANANGVSAHIRRDGFHDQVLNDLVHDRLMMVTGAAGDLTAMFTAAGLAWLKSRGFGIQPGDTFVEGVTLTMAQAQHGLDPGPRFYFTPWLNPDPPARTDGADALAYAVAALPPAADAAPTPPSSSGGEADRGTHAEPDEATPADPHPRPRAPTLPPYYAEAMSWILRDADSAGYALTAGWLQRRLQIGYNASANILETLVAEELISPPDLRGVYTPAFMGLRDRFMEIATPEQVAHSRPPADEAQDEAAPAAPAPYTPPPRPAAHVPADLLRQTLTAARALAQLVQQATSRKLTAADTTGALGLLEGVAPRADHTLAAPTEADRALTAAQAYLHELQAGTDGDALIARAEAFRAAMAPWMGSTA